RTARAVSGAPRTTARAACAAAPGRQGVDTSVAVRIPCAAKSAEDLSTDRVVPVAERGADGGGVRGPGPAAQDLVPVVEEHLRVLAVGKGGEAGISVEGRGGPLPHVTDELLHPQR